MHATSRDALAAVREQLAPESAAEVGTELFSVVTLLDSERGLRRTLADGSTDPDARSGLVGRLLQGKISDAALAVLTTVVRQQWSSPRDLVDSLELLGREVLLRSAERDGQLDTVEDELFRLGRIVAASPSLERVLADRSAVAGQRTSLVHPLLDGKVAAVTSALVTQVVERLREEPADAFDTLSTLAARQREQSVAHVRSAVALSDAQLARLTRTLTTTYGRTVTVHVEVDPALTGGLVVQVGDEVIDGSVAGRLDALRRRLAG
jgi:F-type H+-transporting ATPase subunit delta